MDIITSLIDNIIIKFQIVKTNPNQILILMLRVPQFKRMRVWDVKLMDPKGLNIQRWKKEGETINERGQKSNCTDKKCILLLLC